MQIERPHSKILIFRESRKGSLLFVVFVSAAILAWEWGVWGGPTSLEEILDLKKPLADFPAPVFHILVGLPIPLVPLVLRRLAVTIFGRVITIDGTSRTITKNNRILTRFDGVDRFRLRKWGDGDARLTLFLTSGKRVRVGKLCHKKEADRIEVEIGNVLKEAEAVPEAMDGPPTKDVFIVLSIFYYAIRGVSIFLFMGSVFLLAVWTMDLADTLKIEGNLFVASIFLFIFGLLTYGVSWFLKYLRYVKI
jgi:hypothetical protein